MMETAVLGLFALAMLTLAGGVRGLQVQSSRYLTGAQIVERKRG